MTADVQVALPESFVAEVAAARHELADLAPRILALAARYVALRDRFNGEIVPREVARLSDEPGERLWAESGALQFADRFDELVQQLADVAELQVW